ncbi:MAG: hypothetical protein V1647_05875 [Pseudomonadota bacterium]
MKNVLFILIFVSGCNVLVTDVNRGESPVMLEDSRIVYVKKGGSGNSFEMYKIDMDAVPVWCDIKPAHSSVFRSFSSEFAPERKFHPPMYELCYSGSTMPDVAGMDFQDESPVFAGRAGSNDFFVHEEFNPFLRLYIAGFVIESDYKKFFPFFFDVYRNFCLDEDTECCIKGDGKYFYLTVMADNFSGVKNIYRTVDEITRYIKNEKDDERPVEPAFNIFNSIIMDDCAFNRWYYGALFMNIPTPQIFLDIDGWQKNALVYKRNYVRRIGVKIIDSKRATSGELRLLYNELSRLTDRVN